MKKNSFTIFQNERFIDLGLYQFGNEDCDPGHSFGPATRNHFLFHYIVSGRGTFYSNNTNKKDDVYELHSGQGFLIYPDQITTYVADEKNPWSYIWVEFDGLTAKEALTLAGFSKDTPIFNSRDEEFSLKMFQEMKYLVDNNKETSFNLIGHLYLFLDYMTKSSAATLNAKKNTLQDFYIKESISFIEQNYNKNISVDDIVEICGISRSYFGRIFKEHIGKTPQEFLIDYRMEKACSMLKLTTKSIEEVGKEVGYESQFHFSRAFKSVYGMSPLKWLKNSQKTDS